MQCQDIFSLVVATGRCSGSCFWPRATVSLTPLSWTAREARKDQGALQAQGTRWGSQRGQPVTGLCPCVRACVYTCIRKRDQF